MAATKTKKKNSDDEDEDFVASEATSKKKERSVIRRVPMLKARISYGSSNRKIIHDD